MPVEIRGYAEFQASLKQFPKTLNDSAHAVLDKVAQETVDDVKQEIESAPRIDLGELHRGTHYETRTRMLGKEWVIKPSETADRYAIFVEENTRPHWPPRQALEGWADRHNIPVFLVQRKIAQEGTTGIHMYQKAYQKVLAKGERIAQVIGRKLETALRWHT